MKLNKYFISAGIAVASLSMASCVGDLDLNPTDPSQITQGSFDEDPRGYMERVMADVYLQYATYGANGDASVQGFDGGMSTFQRALFILEEVPTDEASWIPDDADYGLFQYGIIPANNTVIMGTYSRLFINIAVCNQFIQTVNNGLYKLSDEDKALAEEFVRQARILRAGAYYYAIDCFGNVPYADENVLMGEVAPQLSTDFAEGRRLVYEKVVTDLEDIVAWYNTNDPNNRPAYGYVGLDVAESLLVKFYLNEQVYTSDARYGYDNYEKCLEHAEAIINRLKGPGFKGSGLAYGYHQNFGYNNKDFAIGGENAVNEIIWDIPQEQTTLNLDGLGLMSYANGTFMCNAWIGDATDKDDFKIGIAEYNSGNGWKCIVARPQFVEIFDWDANIETSVDKRVKFWKTRKDGFALENISLNQSDWGHNGYIAVKYTNWYINNNNEIDRNGSPAATDQLGVDYAMIRLSEIYLSAAEAILESNGSRNVATSYINFVRERAGLQPLTQATMGDLRDERARELYTEATRRTDLIRWGQWLKGYNWSWKNQQRAGADYPDNFNVYPLPSTTAARNGYVQNPGY
ncbi:MAG: RagB/SusD family nutrient uptake outer membrane protein [Muribaculaceae bacterium]|nr:RagB/SusD family nutrient uptake outer membrane protein [Muribaculaceae bacterium]MDE6642775.1 RagB/SusD family nutrient uptake outer membrane protein [Muribaculaceae bacterium]